MANFIQRASDSISGFGQSYEKFSKQLLIEQYSPGSIKVMAISWLLSAFTSKNFLNT